MPACARKEIFDPEEVGLYFCTSRCVRRAFLCGEDDYTGKNYDHRKVWMEAALRATRDQDSLIRAELESIPSRLASVFPPEYRDVLVAELEQQVCLILKKFNLNETSDDPAATTMSG